MLSYNAGKLDLISGEISFSLSKLVEFVACHAGGVCASKGCFEKCEEGYNVGDVEFFSFLIHLGHYYRQGFCFEPADRVVNFGGHCEESVHVGSELSSAFEGEE